MKVNKERLFVPATIISKLRGYLWHYWRDSEDIRLVATLLDPRLKLMSVWPDEIRKETINLPYVEFKFWQNNIVTDELETCHEETETP
ncbi:9335_t:CDS:1, partial [Diversispora eburnea]